MCATQPTRYPRPIDGGEEGGKERTRVNFKQIAKITNISRVVLPAAMPLWICGWFYCIPCFVGTSLDSIQCTRICSATVQRGSAPCSGQWMSSCEQRQQQTDSELMLLSRCIPANTGIKWLHPFFLVATQKPAPLLHSLPAIAIAETHLADIHRPTTDISWGGNRHPLRKVRWDGVSRSSVEYVVAVVEHGTNLLDCGQDSGPLNGSAINSHLSP